MSELSHEVAGKLVLGGLLTCLTLRSNSDYVTCMIIQYCLDDYIRTSLLYLEYAFILYLSFVL